MPYDTRSQPQPHDLRAPPPLSEPPRGTLLDRLARWLEGGGNGAHVAVAVDLGRVLTERDLASLPRRVIDLYTAPQRMRVRTGFDADRWSRAVLALFGNVTRQMDIPDRGDGFEAFPVGQLVYRDPLGRTHWDRYAFVDGEWRRLFIARVSEGKGTFVETFSLYGLPVPLTFDARVSGGELVLTLRRRLSSPLSWVSRVEYRTGASGDEVLTRGDFRVPILRFRARTEFRATAAS